MGHLSVPGRSQRSSLHLWMSFAVQSTKYDQTPLSGAASNGYESIVQLLLATGRSRLTRRISGVGRYYRGLLINSTRVLSSYCSPRARSRRTRRIRMARRHFLSRGECKVCSAKARLYYKKN